MFFVSLRLDFHSINNRNKASWIVFGTFCSRFFFSLFWSLQLMAPNFLSSKRETLNFSFFMICTLFLPSLIIYDVLIEFQFGPFSPSATIALFFQVLWSWKKLKQIIIFFKLESKSETKLLNNSFNLFVVLFSSLRWEKNKQNKSAKTKNEERKSLCTLKISIDEFYPKQTEQMNEWILRILKPKTNLKANEIDLLFSESSTHSETIRIDQIRDVFSRMIISNFAKRFQS